MNALQRGHVLLSLLTAMVVLAACGGVETVSYPAGSGRGDGFICRPKGKGPFPAVVYNHGLVVDMYGVPGASGRGYNLDGMCSALANDGYLALIPIRKSGRGNMPGHRDEVSRAVDYVKSRPDVDPDRVALMGFSRGGLLTLMVGVMRDDLRALLILAPAPGRGHFARAVRRVPSLRAPVLLLVEADDSRAILEDFEMLDRALKASGKKARTIRYDRGGGHRLFWDVGYYWADVRKFLNETLR